MSTSNTPSSPQGAELGQQRVPLCWWLHCGYCLLMSLCMLLLVWAGLSLLRQSPEDVMKSLDQRWGTDAAREVQFDSQSLWNFAMTSTIVGIVATVGYALAPWLPRRPWAHLYHQLLQLIGVLLLLPAVVCVPLLYWFSHPDVRRWFGVQV